MLKKRKTLLVGNGFQTYCIYLSKNLINSHYYNFLFFFNGTILTRPRLLLIDQLHKFYNVVDKLVQLSEFVRVIDLWLTA